MGDFVLGGFGPMGDLVLWDYIRWDFILGDFILGDLVRERVITGGDCSIDPSSISLFVKKSKSCFYLQFVSVDVV